MAASFKICSGTTRSIFPVDRNRSQSASNQSLFFPKKTQERLCCRVSWSLMISNSPSVAAGVVVSPPSTVDPRKPAISIPPRVERQESGTEKRLEWMKGAVEEIVKNIKKAPLLVQVYADGKEEIRAVEHAVEEEWEGIKTEWENGQRRLPDGIIFVEELRCLLEEGEEDEDGETKIWGIVVQGRGGGGDGGSSPVCYLLKTTRVNGGVGLGLFCTHFSLIRVTSFWETALSQFTNSWLLK